MTMPICPRCGSAEFVRAKAGSSTRFLCENCETFFSTGPDREEADPSRAKKPLRLFLSYPHTAKGEYNICDEIAAFLRSRGHEVWFDEDQLGGHHGDDWRRRIASGIRSSQLVLSCLNRHAVRVENSRRGVCLDELSIAVSVKGGNINTVLLEAEQSVRPSAALSHRQWLDMSEWNEKYAAGEAVYRPWLRQKLEEIARMVESEENYTFDGEISEIAARLGMTDYRLDRRELLEKPFIGREWLAEEVDRWLNTDDGGRKRTLCALYGDPGLGKSAFAVHYAFSSPNVGAIICFEANNSHYNSVPAMVRSLAYQLACRLSDYRSQLLEVLKTPGVMDLDDAELFDQLLVKPMTVRHIDGAHENLCIILDALDECGRGEENAVAAVLGQCVRKFPAWLKVLVTSRRENAVLRHIAPDKIIDVHGSDGKNLEDIRAYYMDALVPAIPDEERRSRTAGQLTARSGGAFLYARLTAEAILDGYLDPDEEGEFPTELSQTLTLWMERLFPDRQEYTDHFRAAAGMILASPEPLPAEELERLLGLSETQTRDLKRRLKVFLTEDVNTFGRETVAFEHRYVQDWLCSEDAGCFCVSRRDAVKTMGLGCYERFRTGLQEMSDYELLYILDFLREGKLAEQLDEVMLCADAAGLMLRRGDWCRTWGKLAQADRLFRNMLDCARYRAERTGTAADRRSLAVGSAAVAGIHEAEGRFAEAMKLYRMSLEIRAALADELQTPEALRDLSVGYVMVAGIHYSRGELPEALELYRKSLDIREKLAAKLRTPESLQDLASCYEKIAGIRQAQGELEEALRLYRKCTEICEALAEELKTPESRRNLSYSYSKVAGIHLARGELAEAMALYRKDREISEALAAELRTPQIRRDLSVCYNKIASIHEERGEWEEALELYRKSLEIRQELADELGTPQARRDVSVNYGRIAGIIKEQGRLEEAMALYRQEMEISEALAGELGTREARRDLAISYGRVGGMCKAQGNPEEAMRWFEKGLVISEQLAEELRTPDSLRDLSLNYSRIAAIREERKEWQAALELYRKCLAIREALAAEIRTRQALRDLSFTYEKIAGIHQAMGERAEAMALYEKDVEICETLAEELGTPGSAWDLIVAHYKTGLCLRDMGREEEAAVHLRLAFEKCKNLAERHPRYSKYLGALEKACTGERQA